MECRGSVRNASAGACATGATGFCGGARLRLEAAPKRRKRSVDQSDDDEGRAVTSKGMWILRRCRIVSDDEGLR
jgi:hypothetical protein